MQSGPTNFLILKVLYICFQLKFIENLTTQSNIVTVRTANHQFDAVCLFIYLFILTYLNSLIVSQIRHYLAGLLRSLLYFFKKLCRKSSVEYSVYMYFTINRCRLRPHLNGNLCKHGQCCGPHKLVG